MVKLVATFFRLARQALLNTASILILIFLPTEILFRLNSWMLFMPALDILNELSMIVLLLVCASAIIAVIVATFGTALACLPITKPNKVEDTICAMVSVGALAVIVLLLLRTLKSWLKVSTGITFTVGSAKPLFMFLVIAVFVLWVWRFGLLPIGMAVQERLSKGNKAVLCLTAVSAICVGVRGVAIHDYHSEQSHSTYSSKALKLPNVILLSIDTLSAVDMSLYGYGLPTTPSLERFAQESYVFDNFFSSSNWTTPSIASLISGLYPSSSGVHHTYGYFLEMDQKKNLGQVLRNNGYRTIAIVANLFAHPLTLGITDSFSVVTEAPVRKLFVTDELFRELYRLRNYRTYWWQEDLLQPISQSALFSLDETSSLFPPELVFNRASPFLNSTTAPTFVWMHVNPPHYPYLPEEPYKFKWGKFQQFSRLKDYEGYSNDYSDKQQAEVDRQRLRYDEFILDTDARVGVFLNKLKKMGRFDDSIIIITADHGESFTKNYLYHGGKLLHQPLIHVPLLIHLPGQKEGRHISPYTGQVDLLPSVLDLLGLPIPEWADGESLKDVMLKKETTRLPKFSMNLDSNSRFASPSKGTVAAMQDGWKFIRYLSSGKEELYLLNNDPHEANNLIKQFPERTKAMRGLIYSHFKLATTAQPN